MSKIKLTLPNGETPVTGKQVTFTAPCDCSQVSCIQINDVDYSVLNTAGESVVGKATTWKSGSLVTVVLDVAGKKAYLQTICSVYTKDEVYTKAETNSAIDTKMSNFYTKTQTDAAIRAAIGDAIASSY